MEIKIKNLLLILIVSLFFLYSDCNSKNYPSIDGNWQATIQTTQTTCLFDDELLDNYIAVIEQSEGSGTITIYDLDDTDFSTYLISYRFTLKEDGTIQILETASYNPAYGLPEGVSAATSAMSANGTASSNLISMTYSETVTAFLTVGPIPQYVCTRGGTITATR